MRAIVPAIQKCMINDAPITAEEFDRAAALHCSRWEARSRDVVRALVVDRESLSTVAARFGMKPQQANVLRRRFLDSVRRAAVIKMPAEQFMRQVTPSSIALLNLLKKDLKQLVHGGYSAAQIEAFLRANELDIPTEELTEYLKVISENARSRKSKGWRR
jgi:hypothetical protein